MTAYCGRDVLDSTSVIESTLLRVHDLFGKLPNDSILVVLVPLASLDEAFHLHEHLCQLRAALCLYALDHLPHSVYLFAKLLRVLRYCQVRILETGFQIIEVFAQPRPDLIEVLVGGVWSQVNVWFAGEEGAQRRILTLALAAPDC